MSAEDQQIFTDCRKKQKDIRSNWYVNRKKSRAGTDRKGCEVTHPDVTAFQEKVQPVYDQYPQFAELVQKIHEAAK